MVSERLVIANQTPKGLCCTLQVRCKYGPARSHAIPCMRLQRYSSREGLGSFGSIERRLRILVLPLTRPLALAVYLRPGDKRPV